MRALLVALILWAGAPAGDAIPCTGGPAGGCDEPPLRPPCFLTPVAGLSLPAPLLCQYLPLVWTVPDAP
jgi:hypothetical protein